MKKRFIAGATCPQCHQMDSLQCWRESEIEIVSCVLCDYKEKQSLSTEANSKSTHQSHQQSQHIIGMFKPK